MTDASPENQAAVLKFCHILPGLFSFLMRLPFLLPHLKVLGSLSEDSPVSVGACVEENAEKYPDRPAILYEDQEKID